MSSERSLEAQTERKRRPAKRLLALAALPFGLVILIYALICTYSAQVLTKSSNRASRFDVRRFMAAESWQTETEDGLTLRGIRLPGTNGRLVVCVHGMNDNWGNVAEIGNELNRIGYEVLLVDLRGHGESDPARLQMGRSERLDLRAAFAWAKDHGFRPERVGWLGLSMGASTIVMEAAENSAIGPIVLDSPYGDLPKLLNSQLTLHSGLPRAFNPGILLAAHYIFGVRTDDLIPAESAAKLQGRPVLLFHGDADSIVPIEQAQGIAEAVGPSCIFLTLPGVEHIECYQFDPSSYINQVDEFFKTHLSDDIKAESSQPSAAR
jgi:uncharacterized protein